MRAPTTGSQQTCLWAPMARIFVTIIGTVLVTLAGVTPAAASSDSEPASIARLLAVTTATDATASCDATDAGATFSNVATNSPIVGGATMNGPAPLGAVCALPFTTGRPGGDCTGRHTIQAGAVNASPSAKVKAELMGLRADGTLIQSFVVKNGDTAQLASRLGQGDWKFGKNANGYSVFAPVPLLRVTVEDQGQTAEAFCSNIPWLDVIQPNGGVVTDSSGGAVTVLAAVPLTDPTQLHLYVDGVDLLAPGVVTPALPFPATGCTALDPCEGTATINGNLMQVSDLIVEIAPSIGTLSSNTVRATLQGLTCGGHFVRVSSAKLPGTLRNPLTETCDVDDLTDKGSASIFAINITDPTPGLVTTTVPTPVAGEACSGTQIVDVNVNGKTLPVTPQSFSPGDGETSGAVYKVTINTTLDATDLITDVFSSADSSLGTFDPGSNRLAGSAREIGGARTYKRFVFATGAVAPIGVDPGATILSANNAVFQEAALQEAVNRQLKQGLEKNFATVMTASQTELANAFIVGISAQGAQTLFDKLCTTPINGKTPGQLFSETVTTALEGFDRAHPLVDNAEWPSPCSCDPKFDVFVSDVTVGTDVTCPISFSDGKIAVTLNLPDVTVVARALGILNDDGKGCQTDACICNPFDPDDCACTCIARTNVNVTGSAKISNIKFTYEITENDLLNTTTSSPSFTTGATVDLGASGGVTVDCLAEVCNILLETFVTILTFGQVDIGPLLEPQIDITDVVNFEEQITPAQPDAIPLKEIKVDETRIANFDQKVSGVVSEVHITPDGISAGLKGSFATTLLDTDVESTPGITLTPAPVPSIGAMRTQGAQDALVGVSDDAINMMFASLTAAGKLKPSDDPQGCVDTGATVGSLLPPDCETLNVGDPLATAAAQGYCHAIRGDSCATLINADPVGLSTEKGVCFGASGAVCSQVANFDLLLFGACSITPNLNLKATQPLLFCAKGDVPPRMLFPNTGTPGTVVPSALRLNDLSVALVIDRTENHVVEAPLSTAPSCFAGNTAADCSVFSACLDLNLNFTMNSINLCPDGKPGFKSTFDSIQIVNRDIGVVCSGVTSPTTDGEVLEDASDDTITIPLGTNAGNLSPDICGAGLDLGFLQCATPQILGVEADGKLELRDYLAISCTLK
jgi:hypothetical protein